MNRDVKIALCTLALMTGGFAIQSTESAHAAQATEAATIAAPENGIVTKEYVETIVESGADVQQVLDRYMDQIVTVGRNAFSGCTANLDFSRAVNLKSVENAAFYNSKLSAINLENVTSIGTSAFARCTLLTDVRFGESGVREIPHDAFAGCVELESIKIPNSVEVIGPSAFANTGLHYVVLPNSVNFLDSYAFAGCSDMVYARIENPNIKTNASSLNSCFEKNHTSIFEKLDWHGMRTEAVAVKPKESDLKYTSVLVFCDTTDPQDRVYPLSEMENFKLLTATVNGEPITIDANARRENVGPFTQDHNGIIVVGNGCSHVDLYNMYIGDVKTVVFADGVKRVLGSLYSNPKYDVVIPDSVVDAGDLFYVKTAYTNNTTVIDRIKKDNELDQKYGTGDRVIDVQPLGGEQYMMLSDDAEIHALWAELAQLRARDSGHLALDEASALFDDSAFLNSSRAAHDKLVDDRELKNKLREEIEKLQNAE